MATVSGAMWRPKTTRLAGLVTLVLALPALAACSSMLLGGSGASAGNPIGQDTRSSTQASADDRISATIRARYAADPELSSAGLRVETLRGTVTLRGVVSSFDLRDRAVRLAQDVAGVLRVDNQVSVRSNQGTA